MAAKNLIIAPRYGGQLDYMNNNNSLLIEGKEIKADRRMQYWTQSDHAAVFSPSVDNAVDMLRYARDNYGSLMEKFKLGMEETVKNHTWDIVADRMLGLIKE
jgi:hypothetical protein